MKTFFIRIFTQIYVKYNEILMGKVLNVELTGWSLLPPIVAILMVLLTRRVLVSLGVGIVVAALFLAEFHLGDMFKYIWESFKLTFVEEGVLDTHNVFILLFILMLGVLTSFMSMLGGTKAFGDWMIQRIKSRKNAQVMPMLLGMIIFIDDYFNSLTVGPISRPITDRHRISRAKLAYIVDSTAAPISVVAPISSWGAYIIGIIGSILVSVQVTNYEALEAFLAMIPMNFYVWAALGTILVIIISGKDFGPMKKHEAYALETGNVYGGEDTIAVQEEHLRTSEFGSLKDLFIPIFILVFTTLAIMYWSGYNALDNERTLMNVLGEADVALSLFLGGFISLISVLILFSRQAKRGVFKGDDFFQAISTGVKSMVSAVFILLFAWAIAYLIEQLQTGEYLGNVIASANFNVAFLPVLIFLLAGFIAFSTGTSWGSFAILLPIAGQIAGATEIDLLLPALAAVLAGAVFGDHCSPISDTTILSATGAGCNHIDHVITQLPYAITSATIAGIGYVVLGFTNTWLGLVSVLICLLLFYILLTTYGKNKS